jgi:two-component system sensor histidine kinase HydH
MRQHTKRRQPGVVAAALGAGAAFLLLSALATILIQGERQRARLLAQYQTERVASGLFVIIAQAAAGELTNETLATSLIRGATYDSTGRLEGIRVGDAPLLLDASGQQPGEDRFRYDAEQESLTIIRRRWLPEPLRRGRLRRPSISRNEFILVETDAAGYFSSNRLLTGAQIFVPLLIAGVVAAATALIRNNFRLRRRFESQRQLVQLGEAARTLAHEIKNPLGAIRISTGVLRKKLPANAHRTLADIDGEVQRLTTLADRMGDFIRDPLGAPQVIDIADMLATLGRRQTGVLLQAPAGGVRVLVDAERLRSVLENLLQNAHEAHSGEEPILLEVSVSGDEASVRVSDRGSGVPDSAQSKVFDPFYTTKSKGSGIGLAIAYRFVEAAGGRLELLPRGGGGTVARVALPLAKEAD